MTVVRIHETAAEEVAVEMNTGAEITVRHVLSERPPWQLSWSPSRSPVLF